MSDKKVVAEHFQNHTITEWLHIPTHDGREETLVFTNAKKELEKVEHVGCNVCGTMEKRESHHIIERCYAQSTDLMKMANLLFYEKDYHGHVKRDFKTPEAFRDWLASHEVLEEAFDSLYNQEILCARHHRGEGEGRHGTTGPTFDAIRVAKDGWDVSMGDKEYKATHGEANTKP